METKVTKGQLEPDKKVVPVENPENNFSVTATPEAMKPEYANVCNVRSSGSEMVLDFGFLTPGTKEIQITRRLVVNLQVANGLAQTINNTILAQAAMAKVDEK